MIGAQVNRRRLWTGLAAAAAVTAGVTGWVLSGDLTTPTKASARTAGEAQALLQAGIMQGQFGDFADAGHTFKRVLKLDPGNRLAWYNLGIIAAHDGRTADARAAYDRALKIDPSFVSALYNEAVLIEASEPDRAITLLQRAIAANPNASTAYLHLGGILAKEGHDREAKDAFGHALRADPSLRPLVPKPFTDSASPSPSPTSRTKAGTHR